MRCVHDAPRAWIAAVLGLVLTVSGLSPASEPAPSPADLDQLVGRLAAPRFKDREDATKKLNAIGAPALPALRRAMQSADTETQRRAAELVAAIESRSTSTAILAPTKVRLKANNTSLAGVLRDLSRQSNIRLFLAREPVNLGDRPVTLDTGEVSFWEALDQLCRQAKIHLRPEIQDLSASANAPRKAAAVLELIETNPQPELVGGEHRLVLQDGSPSEHPTAYLGAVRLRILPNRSYKADAGDESDRWVVEILSEPKLRWLGPLALLWDEATGADGRRLTTIPTLEQTAKQQGNGLGAGNINAGNLLRNVLGGGGNIMVQFGGEGDDDDAPSTGLQNVRRQEVPLRWKLPPDANAKLAALRGRLKGMVLGRGAAIETADLKKAGADPISGKEGFKLTVKKSNRRNDGKVEMDVAVETPARGEEQQGNQMRIQIVGGGIQIGGNGIQIGGNGGTPVADHGFRIWDAKKRPFKISANRISSENQSTVYRLLLEPPAKDSEPTKLEFHAPYPMGVEEKFSLRDIRTR